MDICSAIVYSKIDHTKQTISWLGSQKGVDVHQTEEKMGKIIITVEDSTDCNNGKITEKLTAIHHYKHVLSVSLVSQFSDI